MVPARSESWQSCLGPWGPAGGEAARRLVRRGFSCPLRSELNKRRQRQLVAATAGFLMSQRDTAIGRYLVNSRHRDDL